MEIISNGDGEWYNKATGEYLDKEKVIFWLIANSCSKEDFAEYYA